MANILGKLNIFKAAQNKIVDDFIDTAEKWLKNLDLDGDGQKDLEEEILPALRGLADNFKQATGSVDAVQLNKTFQAAKKLTDAANELATISKEVLDTEQAQAAINGTINAIKVVIKFLEDAIAHQAAKQS